MNRFRGWLLPLFLALALQAQSPGQSEKAVLEVAPSLGDLGAGWTTNVIAYLIDPKSQPSEVDYRTDPKTSLLLHYQRSVMATNNRTGCGLILYGRGDLVQNSGLYRVFIQRWNSTRALHNSWVNYKMNPARVVRAMPHVGEDYYWTQEWWRQTLVRQNLVFRRGLFHIVVEAGGSSDYQSMIWLAQVMDAKIRGRPVPAPREGGNVADGVFERAVVAE